MSITIKCESVRRSDLKPGDFYTYHAQQWWDAIMSSKHGSSGPHVLIHINPNAHFANDRVFRLTVHHEVAA